MSERNLLSAMMQSRAAWASVSERLSASDMGEQSNLILGAISEYYGRDAAAEEVDGGILTRSITRKLSSPKHKEAFEALIEVIDGTKASPANVLDDFVAVKRDAAAGKLASALAAGKDPSEVRPLLTLYEAWCDGGLPDEAHQTEIMRGERLPDLVHTSYEDGALIRVHPRALNERIDGGLLPGHHMVVFARPEMGKTMLLVNMIFGFLREDRTVLYIGNEDPITDVVMRVVSRLTGMTKYEILKDPEKADADARDAGYDNLILAGLAPGTPREIEALVQEYKPDVLMIDQLRNINVGEEHFVQKLEKAATEARNIGKRNACAVISVTQAGDSASGKAVLDMGDVDSSNTGIPAQADVMVGIGATHEDEAAGRRVLSLPKNKRSGRHDFFPVIVDPLTCTIRGVD